MSEHDDDGANGDEPEGVRIIGADEAAEALEREDVARRRGPDEPRPGDAPGRGGRAADGPEPVLRFPLSSAQEPQEDLPHWTEPPTGSQPRVGEIFDEEGESDWGGVSAAPRWHDDDHGGWDDDIGDVRSFGGDDTRVGALDDDRPDPEDFFTFDDIDEAPPGRSVFDVDDEPVAASTPQAPSRPDEWAPEAYDDDYDVYDDEPGAAYDDDPAVGDDGIPRPIVVGSGRVTPGAPRPPRVEPPAGPTAGVGGDRDIRQAAIVGVGFIAAAAVLFSIGPAAAAILVVAVVTLASAELFAKVREVGYKPAALLGVVGTAGLTIGTYHRGEAAIPVGIVLIVAFGMLWYLAGAGEGQTTINLGVTVLGFAWVGVFGSYATAMLGLRGGAGIGDPGTGILFGAIVGTVAYDVGGYFVGRSAGRSPLSEASPNKMVEGLLGGCIAAIAVSVIYGILVEPLGGVGDGLRLGLAVAVAAPLGDLCQSLIKRDLGIKDMGSVLPGHGGFLDRFDALLFVLPTVYYVAKLSDFFLS